MKNEKKLLFWYENNRPSSLRPARSGNASVRGRGGGLGSEWAKEPEPTPSKTKYKQIKIDNSTHLSRPSSL